MGLKKVVGEVEGRHGVESTGHADGFEEGVELVEESAAETTAVTTKADDEIFSYESDHYIINVEALHPDSAILGLCPDFLAQAHTAGQRVHVWTVDSRLEMKEMCRLGVDAFVTDCPDNGRRIVDEYFSEQTDLGSRE